MNNSILFTFDCNTLQKDVVDFTQKNALSFARKDTPVVVEKIIAQKDLEEETTYSIFENMELALLDVALDCEESMDFFYETGLKALEMYNGTVKKYKFFIITLAGRKYLESLNFFGKKKEINLMQKRKSLLNKLAKMKFSPPKVKYKIDAQQLTFSDIFEIEQESISTQIDSVSLDVLSIEKQLINLQDVIKTALYIKTKKNT